MSKLIKSIFPGIGVQCGTLVVVSVERYHRRLLAVRRVETRR